MWKRCEIKYIDVRCARIISDEVNESKDQLYAARQQNSVANESSKATSYTPPSCEYIQDGSSCCRASILYYTASEVIYVKNDVSLNWSESFIGDSLN